MEQLRREATKENLELNTHNMQKFINGHVKVKTMLLMLQNELDIGFKMVYPDSMEDRFLFQKDTLRILVIPSHNTKLGTNI